MTPQFSLWYDLVVSSFGSTQRATTAQKQVFKLFLAPAMASLSIRGGARMYAIIETGGKQIKVTEGQEIYIELLNTEAGETVTFDRVLMVGGDDIKVGSPMLDGATVTGKVDKHGKGKKITVYKYKPKKNYRRKQGHRQPYTKVVIDKINA